MQTAKISNKGADSPLLEFIMKYFPVLIGLLIAFPLLLEWVAKIGSNIRAADAAATVKDEQTKAETSVKTQTVKAKASAQENQVGDLNVLKTKSDLILKGFTQTTKDRLTSAAQMLSFHLGTSALNSKWGPSAWTENDSDAAKVLTDNWYYIKQLEQLYKGVYTTNRDLKNDVYRFLDTSDFDRVKKYYKSKKSSYFG